MAEIELLDLVEMIVAELRMVDQHDDERRFAQRHDAADPLDHRRARQAFRNGDAPAAWPPRAHCAALRLAVALAGPRRPRARRAEIGMHPLAQLLAVVIAQAFVADAAGELAQPLFQFGPPLRRVEHAARRLARPQQIGERPRLGEHRAEGIRPARLDQIVRDPCPRAAARSARVRPAWISGSAISAARHAAFSPAWSPSKHSTGSRAMRHNSSSWFSVSAVPSGATAFSKPACGERDHVHVAFDGDDRAGLCAEALRARAKL